MDRNMAAVLLALGLTLSRWSQCIAISEMELQRNLLANYLSSELPSKSSPTEVKIGVYFNRLAEVDEGEMHFTGTFYLRQNWKDPRLQFDPDQLDGKKEFRISDDAVDKIWKPDIFFRNGFNAEHQNVIRDDTLVKVNASGFVWFVIKLTVSFYCPMRLQKYPFDTQTCSIMFESFGHTMDEYYLRWLEAPFQLDGAIEIHKYTLTKTILYDCSQNYTAGAFPCLEGRFVLVRETGYFFIQIFVPTMLLVIMSWFVFWLDIHDFPHRLGLSFLLIVCMILVHTSSAANNMVAKVQYIKALDIWLLMNLMFLFAVLIQCIVVKVIYSRSYRTTEHVNLDDPSVKRVHDNKVSCRIDLVSRVAFPLVYLLAVSIYFGVYRA